jgi:2-keto-4-pentenoate hydratase/2-oxohepta-3-ene-1,7-dioic acid hydratase in catechol pathway
VTIRPGDIITLGTDGVPTNVKHGDVIEIEVTGLGTLRNQVLREEV